MGNVCQVAPKERVVLGEGGGGGIIERERPLTPSVPDVLHTGTSCIISEICVCHIHMSFRCHIHKCHRP